MLPSLFITISVHKKSNAGNDPKNDKWRGSKNETKMRSTKLSTQQLIALRPLEEELQNAVARSEPDTAIEVATKIQAIFKNDRTHFRLLRAKLWAFEASIDANRLAYAESGLIGVRQLARPSTRIALEAGGLLAVSFLRQKKISEAKAIITDVIANINNITSEKTRHQFQKRFIERIEEECILAELIGTEEGKLDVHEIDAKAILLIQNRDEDEILRLIGNSIPATSISLLTDVRNFSLLQLPAPDRKLLAPPPKTQESKTIGKTTFSMLRRIAWKTFCKPSSPIYKLWSVRAPKVFNEGYFSAAIATTFGDFKIGIPLLASGVIALVMKYSAEEFCEYAKPKGLMIGREDKDV